MRRRAGGVYLQSMASPSEPVPQSQIGTRRGRIQESEPEAFGVLTVARHVKDDGRMLILYTRRRDG